MKSFFLSLLSNCFLLVYKNAMYFCMLLTYPSVSPVYEVVNLYSLGFLCRQSSNIILQMNSKRGRLYLVSHFKQTTSKVSVWSILVWNMTLLLFFHSCLSYQVKVVTTSVFLRVSFDINEYWLLIECSFYTEMNMFWYENLNLRHTFFR